MHKRKVAEISELEKPRSAEELASIRGSRGHVIYGTSHFEQLAKKYRNTLPNYPSMSFEELIRIFVRGLSSDKRVDYLAALIKEYPGVMDYASNVDRSNPEIISWLNAMQNNGSGSHALSNSIVVSLDFIVSTTNMSMDAIRKHLTDSRFTGQPGIERCVDLKLLIPYLSEKKLAAEADAIYRHYTELVEERNRMDRYGRRGPRV